MHTEYLTPIRDAGGAMERTLERQQESVSFIEAADPLPEPCESHRRERTMNSSPGPGADIHPCPRCEWGILTFHGATVLGSTWLDDKQPYHTIARRLALP